MRRGANREIVSVQTVIASVQALTSGLTQLRDEVTTVQNLPTAGNDRFIVVMQVRLSRFGWFHANSSVQPFLRQVAESVGALNNMASALGSQLDSLLVFFGENPNSPEAPKPEDFFGLILTFSTSLQVRTQSVLMLSEGAQSCVYRKPLWSYMTQSPLLSRSCLRWRSRHRHLRPRQPRNRYVHISI